MKGKKLMAMLMAGSMLLAGLTGCGGANAKGGNAAADAADYPNGPVTIICPWGVGGGADVISRKISEVAKNYFDQPIIVENHTGASGTIGMMDAMDADADGYTMVVTNGPLFSLTPKYIDVSYELSNFTMLRGMRQVALMIFTNPQKSGMKTFDDLINYGKTHKITYATSSGPGGDQYVVSSAMFKALGIEAEPVVMGSAVRQEMLSVLRHELTEEAEKHRCNIHDLACTLLLAAVSENRFLLAHIGDGVIGYLDGDTLKVASVPDNGEFANETTFVTSDKAAETMRLFKGELRDKAAFVLMSDGTEHSLYHKPSRALADILTDVIQRACLIRADVLQRQLADTFASVVCPRTQDDCSIAILARPGKALRIVDQLSVEERRRLYHIQRARAHTARRIRRYDAMLVLLEQPHSLRQIAVKIHLNPRYTKQRLGQLEQLGLIEQTNGWYQKA